MKVNSLIIDTNKKTEFNIKCLSTFLTNGIDVDLYTYDVKNIKKLVKDNSFNILDAREILDASVGKKFTVYGVLANHFRYLLLLKKGGWWVDSDCICLSEPKCDKDFLLAGFYSSDRQIILPNINVMYYNNNDIAKEIMNELISMVDNVDVVPEYFNGGQFWYRVLAKIQKYVSDPYTFNPIGCSDNKAFLKVPDKEMINRFKNSSVIHMWDTTVGKEGKVNDSLCDMIMSFIDNGENITYTKLKQKFDKFIKLYNTKEPD